MIGNIVPIAEDIREYELNISKSSFSLVSAISKYRVQIPISDAQNSNIWTALNIGRDVSIYLGALWNSFYSLVGVAEIEIPKTLINYALPSNSCRFYAQKPVMYLDEVSFEVNKTNNTYMLDIRMTSDQYSEMASDGNVYVKFAVKI